MYDLSFAYFMRERSGMTAGCSWVTVISPLGPVTFPAAGSSPGAIWFAPFGCSVVFLRRSFHERAYAHMIHQISSSRNSLNVPFSIRCRGRVCSPFARSKYSTDSMRPSTYWPITA